jgi:hypothetical protein
VDGLTAELWQMLLWAAAGKNKPEIAHLMGLSTGRVDRLMRREDERASAIYSIIGVQSQPQAAAWCVTHLDAIAGRPEFQAPVYAALRIGGTMDPAEGLPAVASPAAHLSAHSEAHAASRSAVLYIWLTGFNALAALLLAFYLIPLLLRAPFTLFDNVFLNFYFVLPLAAGGLPFALAAAGWIEAPRWEVRPRQRTLYFFFAAGLIVWAIGGMTYALYDLFSGTIEPRTATLADLGFLGHALVQTLFFLLLWWAGPMQQSGRAGRWSVVIAVIILTAVYTAGLSTLRLFYATQVAPGEAALNIAYLVFDCVSIVLAAALLISAFRRPLQRQEQLALLFMALGMLFQFCAGAGWQLTLSFPPDHPASYGGGGWPDLLFFMAFWMWGCGLALALAGEGALDNAPGPRDAVTLQDPATSARA